MDDLTKEIYLEELKIEEDCGVYYIVDMHGAVIYSTDCDVNAEMMLEEIKRRYYDRKD